MVQRLLSRLINSRAEDDAVSVWHPPAPETCVYVIGDIHGAMDSLNRLMDEILHDAMCTDTEDAIVVFVGDYVDRGEYSREVLADVYYRASQWPESVVCLKGNHEQMMLDFLDDPCGKGRRWLRHGGLQTLASFGVRGMINDQSMDADVIEVAEQLNAKLPDGLRQWLADLPLTWRSGNLVVAHAALDPKARIDEQSSRHLLWGCSRFEKIDRTDGFWVAHGHNVVDAPSAASGRIPVDTGAVFGGKLSAAAIDPSGEVRFLQA